MKSICNIFFLMLGMLWLGVPASYAQELLSLESAIGLALENNYGIKVARNDAYISENEAYPGNAGLLPKLDLGGGFNYTNNDVNVVFASPSFPEVDASGVQSNSTNVNLGLTYTVFDGLGNVYNYRILKASAELTQQQTRSLIENTIAQVITTYYQVARVNENLRTLQETVDISNDRLNRARNQFGFGATTKLAVLNAEVDLNTDSVSLATSYVNLQNAKRDLNLLVGLPVDREVVVSEEIEFLSLPSLEEVLALAKQNNASLRIAEESLQISELSLKLNRSFWWPRLDINAGYGWQQANNGEGNILQKQTTLGLNAGASLNFPIFDGNRRRKSVENARVDLASSKTLLEEAEATVERDIYNAYYSYQTSLRILSLEQRSLDASRANFERTRDSFDLGQATNVEFREAQNNLLLNQVRLNELSYDLKLAETELLRLTGILVQQPAAE